MFLYRYPAPPGISTPPPHSTLQISSSWCSSPPMAITNSSRLSAMHPPLRAMGQGYPMENPPARVPRPEQDRKSTRLNSSHANISYAVFCLKKKNIMTEQYLRVTAYY